MAGFKEWKLVILRILSDEQQRSRDREGGGGRPAAASRTGTRGAQEAPLAGFRSGSPLSPSPAPQAASRRCWEPPRSTGRYTPNVNGGQGGQGGKPSTTGRFAPFASGRKPGKLIAWKFSLSWSNPAGSLIVTILRILGCVFFFMKRMLRRIVKS